ncbi:MAG: helix-turn-helix transcriptional regulator [Cellulosilyticaceae bacterium]
MLNVSKFYKHIFINLLFITISIIAMFFALFLGNQYMVSKQSLEQSYINRAKEISTSLDDKLSSGINALTQLSINTTTQEYVALNKYNPKLTVDLYKYFTNTISLVPNLELTIGVYNPNIDTVLSNQSTSTLNVFLKKFGLDKDADILNFINHNYKESDLLSSSMTLQSVDLHDTQYLCYIVRKDQVANEPLFFVIYPLNSLIRPFNEDTSVSEFSIHIDKLAMSNTDTLAPNTYSVRSEVLPISYNFSFVTTPSIAFKGMFTQVIVVFVFMLLISFLLIYRFANKVYSPVKSLVSSTKDVDSTEEILDEFEYIRTRVESLKNAIHGYNLSGKDMLLKEILYGIKKENIKDLLTTNNIHLFTQSTFMVIMVAKKVGNLQLDTPTAKTYIELSLTGVFPQLKEYENYKLINISPLTNVLFINNISRLDIKSFFNDLSSTLNEYCTIITHPVELVEVSPKFYGVNELIKNDKIGNSCDIILEEEIVIQARIPYVYSESDKRLLIYNITSANKEELLTLLNNLLEENLFNRELAPQVHHEFLSSLCSTLGGICPTLKDPNDLFTLLTSIKDRTELKIAIINLFLEYYNYLNSDDAKKDMKYNFLDYIHNNYDQDISLADMANEFNLAVNYVGVLFKEKTGYNFKDYLNTYRINVAKQILLETPNIKIKDLSTSVGFINTNTFIRIFKKYESMSPGQYQKYVLDTHPET